MIVYGGFLTGAFLSALIMNYFFKLNAFSNVRRLILAYVLVSIPFIIWDILATDRGHWSFNPDFVTGFEIGNLPGEEVAFFFVIPFVMYVVWLLTAKYLKDKKLQIKPIFFQAIGVLLLLFGILFANTPYTFLVFLLGGVFILLLQILDVAYTRQFWVYQFVLFVLFFISNTVLTAPPVVEYGDFAITGARVGTIPIEDFVYNFVLINAIVLITANKLKIKH